MAYGGHSLTAVQLCSAVVAEFGKRPDLLFLTSADCTVRELLKKFERSGADKDAGGKEDDGCVVRLSSPGVAGMPLLIFCSAGTGVALLPGCGKTSDETAGVRRGVAR